MRKRETLRRIRWIEQFLAENIVDRSKCLEKQGLDWLAPLIDQKTLPLDSIPQKLADFVAHADGVQPSSRSMRRR
jgi:hypothetical protein